MSFITLMVLMRNARFPLARRYGDIGTVSFVAEGIVNLFKYESQVVLSKIVISQEGGHKPEKKSTGK